MSKIEFQYTRLYLKKYFVDNDDPRKDDDDFINKCICTIIVWR